ncbi:hypothetical protein AOQ84DRAFT_400314 [Glonium stellatum]|uniref:FAD/NAD(P)-binding domain-containing protein n=1 Tax=Glonium stellatum TaxID=574774 RepID=A0A8E2ESH2_9PEZI|nr:hypothetical protein AOQ84DRAFT_400314 [Glonium stellatum]
MVKTVVILGAGWAGLPLAHKLLKYTLPKAKDDLKVFLVSPNSHFYWNLAAQLFLPIGPSFAQYSVKNFEFVLGKAKRLDPETNTVETLSALHSLQEQIQVAKSIVIAGAGLTGVETAGELAYVYGGEKDITLIISGERALQASHILSGVSQVVEKDLQKLGVKLVRNAQVKDAQTKTKEEKDAAVQTTLTLSNGSTIVTELYLPLFGVQVNTSFVPASLLDSAGNLVLDKAMRVVGTENVWGIGDVGNLETKQVTRTDAQIVHLSAALDHVLLEVTGEVKEYKPSGKTMIFITMGKKHATGQIGGWKLWG